MATNSDGVYFRNEDYASFWLRLLIDVIDVLVVSVVCFILTLALWTMFPADSTTLNLTLAVVVLVSFCYMVLLKRSGIGTIGYRVGRVRVVGLDGKTASISSLSMRLMFAALGPLNYIDLLWIFSDTHRQCLRDKIANTYVIKANARPAGSGRITYRQCDILGYNFLFQEVEIPEPRIETEARSVAGQF